MQCCCFLFDFGLPCSVLSPNLLSFVSNFADCCSLSQSPLTITWSNLLFVVDSWFLPCRCNPPLLRNLSCIQLTGYCPVRIDSMCARILSFQYLPASCHDPRRGVGQAAVLHIVPRPHLHANAMTDDTFFRQGCQDCMHEAMVSGMTSSSLLLPTSTNFSCCAEWMHR
jgi:hypothetical protein